MTPRSRLTDLNWLNAALADAHTKGLPMSDTFNPALLDPGIRNVVLWLRELGFNTTDSGDGRTKIELIASGDALAFPHVFMRVEEYHAIRMDQRADDLARHLRDRGIEPGPNYPDLQVELSYSPFDQVGILALYGLDDEGLARATPREA